MSLGLRDYGVDCINNEIFRVLQEHLTSKGYKGCAIDIGTNCCGARYLFIDTGGNTGWNTKEGTFKDNCKQRLSIEEVFDLPVIYHDHTPYVDGYTTVFTKSHVDIPGLTLNKIGISKDLILALAEEIKKEQN